MTTNPPFELPRPGLTRKAYLKLLTAGHDTGWWDECGKPAPWPEDFLDPDSDWHQQGGAPQPYDTAAF